MKARIRYWTLTKIECILDGNMKITMTDQQRWDRKVLLEQIYQLQQIVDHQNYGFAKFHYMTGYV